MESFIHQLLILHINYRASCFFLRTIGTFHLDCFKVYLKGILCVDLICKTILQLMDVSLVCPTESPPFFSYSAPACSAVVLFVYLWSYYTYLVLFCQYIFLNFYFIFSLLSIQLYIFSILLIYFHIVDSVLFLLFELFIQHQDPGRQKLPTRVLMLLVLLFF